MIVSVFHQDLDNGPGPEYVFVLFVDTIWELQKGTMTMFMAEIVGTGILIFIGCMGCIGTMGVVPPSPMQTAIIFGLTINLIIMVRW